MVVVLVMFSLAAEDSLFIGDGDIGSIRMYDSQGIRLNTTTDVASQIGQGWIIQNQYSPILIITPKGSINLYEDSILITGDLISDNPSLYLVKGKAVFNTYDMKGGTLSVSTPASLFQLVGDGEMFVITDDVEESATVFKGEVTSYNSITHATRGIPTFQKLFMHESPANPKPIASGYYLTYATYPNLMLAKQLISEMATKKTEIPSIPKFSSVLQKPQQITPPVMNQGVTIIPAEIPTFSHVEESAITYPPKPYTISVTSVPLKTPSAPNSLSMRIVPQPQNRIVITVRPLAPEAPFFTKATIIPPALLANSISVTTVPLAVTIIPPTLLTDSISVTTAPIIAEEKVEPLVERISEAIESEPVVEPVNTGTKALVAPVVETILIPEATEVAPETDMTTATTIEDKAPAQTKTPGILFTQEENLKAGSVGLEISYSFLFDGTDSNSLHHTLLFKPYVSYKSFAMTLQSSVSTEDFSLFTSNVTPVPSGTLEMLGYGFKFISSLRFGYSSSPFFLALDNNKYHSSLTDQYFAPRFGDTNKLSLYNRIEIGKFSSNLYFDDLYLTNLLSTTTKHQFASFSLEYAKQEGYHFSVSLGSLARIERVPTWKVELYPNVNFLFPLINVRTTQLGLMVAASGYLPAYPTFEFDQFVDLDIATLFPNYQVSAGLALKQGSFSAKLLGSLRKGDKNRNLMTSDLAYAIDTSYNSIFDIFAETGFAGEHFDARLTVNLPFASDLTLASVTSATYKADFSQLTLSYKQKGFTFSFGLQEVGIGATIKDILDGSKEITTLLGGDRATSFLSAGYTTGPLTIKAKAAYPANATVYTTPKITITASYKLGLQF